MQRTRLAARLNFDGGSAQGHEVDEAADERLIQRLLSLMYFLAATADARHMRRELIGVRRSLAAGTAHVVQPAHVVIARTGAGRTIPRMATFVFG